MSTHLWVFKWCKCVADTCFLSKVVEMHVTNLWPFFRAGFRIMEIKWKNHLFCQLQDWVSNCRFSPDCLFWPLSLAHQPDQHLQGISLSCFLVLFWMQISLFILHLFINQTFHSQTNYTFKYRNMFLVANHRNNQSQLITEWKKGKEMAAPPSQSQCYPVSGMVTKAKIITFSFVPKEQPPVYMYTCTTSCSPSV